MWNQTFHARECDCEILGRIAARLRNIRAAPAPAAHLSRDGSGNVARLELRDQIGRNPCNQHDFSVLNRRQNNDRGTELLLELIDRITQRLSISTLNLYSQNLNP